MSPTPALVALGSGLMLGLGLIVAIGAQNAFVLRQGLRVEHVAAVVAVCALSDVALIAAGVLGAGAAITRAPALVPAVCFAGAAFLLGYAALAITDECSLAGVVRAHMEAKTQKLPLIIGATFRLRAGPDAARWRSISAACVPSAEPAARAICAPEAASNGNSTRKVEPAPEALATEMRPSICSTRRLEIAKPSPVPP